MASQSVSNTAQDRWTRSDTWAFWAFGIGMLMENYIFSLAPIANGWVHIPTSLTSLLLSWAPLWLIIGIAVAGPVADRMGRKNTFYLTMTLYAIGGIGLIVFSVNYGMLLLFLAVLLFAAGGEMNTIMIASHEMMPRQHRSKTMMLELNFINLGGLLLAILALASAAWSNSVELQKVSVGIALLLVLTVLLFARANTPESLRWLVRRGEIDRAREAAVRYYGDEEGTRRLNAVMASVQAPAGTADRYSRVSVGVRLYATMATSFAGAAGFGLMTYVLGPYYFSHLTSQIIFVAGLVGFLSGFFGLWGDRLSRKTLLLVGYLGTFLLTLVIYLTVGAWTRDLAIFWVLLVILNVFVNIGYLTEDTLKGEVWPTARRGTYTALVRFVSIGLYIVTIYVTAHFNLRHTILFNDLVWAIGASGAVLWYIKGQETGRGASLETASNER